MKRRISLLLAVVMILGSFSMVFAAEETAEEAAGAFLKEVGVLEGINGDLKLEDNLRRQDMVVLIARLHGAEEEAEKFPTEDLKFTDFKDPYYRPIIAWAVANELIEGHTPERFGFNENVTAQQYATVLLRALGYNDKVANKEGYEKALEEAKALGILENVEVENDTVVTRGQMAVMTFNALGVKVKDSEETLAEKLGIKMPESDVLEVVDVRTENLAEVEVELSNAKLAKADLENVDNYRILGHKIAKAELIDNVIRLTLDTKDFDPLTRYAGYELIIRGLDKEINGTYKFTATDNTAPYVENVTALGEYGIKVTTSEPVASPQERHFLIDGKNVAMVVEQYGRDIILTPYYNRAFGEGDAVLTVSTLKDHAGFIAGSEDFDIVIEKDEEAPVALGAEARGTEITVEFDKDVYANSVKAGSRGNAYMEIGRNKIYATDAKKVDTNKVQYTFDRVFSSRASLVVKGVENHSKVAMEETEVDVVEVKDNLEPEVISHKVYFLEDNKAEVVLTFDKNIDKDSEGKYKLFEKEVKKDNEVSEKIDEDNVKIVDNKVTIPLKGLKKDTDYVLEIEDLKDTAGNKMYVYYVDFTVPAEYDNLAVVDVDLNWRTREIKISFNNPVDRDVAEHGGNYVFKLANGHEVDLIDAGGYAIVERNGKVVSLVVPGLNEKEYRKLTISSTLKDIYGYRLEEDVVYDLITEELETAEYTVDKDGNVAPLKDEITFRTNAKKTFTIAGDVDKLVIDAPNAHIVIKDGVTVDEVEIVAIGSDSLEINGTVEKLVISTNKVVKVFGNVEDMVVATTVDKAKVKVAFKTTDSEGKEIVGDFVEFELKEKGNEFKIEEKDGKPLRGETEEQELESAKNTLSKAIKDAEKVLDEAKKVLDKGNEKVKDLQNAIYAAKVAVIEAKDIEEVNGAKTKLEEAKNAVKNLLEEKAANEALLEKVKEAIGSEIEVEVEGEGNVDADAVKNAIEALEIGEGDDKKTVGVIDGLNIDVDVTEDEEEGVKTYTAKITLTIDKDKATKAELVIDNVNVKVVEAAEDDD